MWWQVKITLWWSCRAQPKWSMNLSVDEFKLVGVPLAVGTVSRAKSVGEMGQPRWLLKSCSHSESAIFRTIWRSLPWTAQQTSHCRSWPRRSLINAARYWVKTSKLVRVTQDHQLSVLNLSYCQFRMVASSHPSYFHRHCTFLTITNGSTLPWSPI